MLESMQAVESHTRTSGYVEPNDHSSKLNSGTKFGDGEDEKLLDSTDNHYDGSFKCNNVQSWTVG